jgi:Retrotransposon gag protein
MATMEQLVEAIQTLETRLGNLETFNQQILEDNEAKNDQITTLTKRLHDTEGLVDGLLLFKDQLGNTTPESSNPTDPAAAPATDALPKVKSERLPDPPMYAGGRRDLRQFITKLRIKLEGNADRFPTEQNRLYYAVGRLEKGAGATADPFIRNKTITTVNQLISLLERTYDNPDRIATAMRQLSTLRQGNREFTVFYAKFQELISELDYSEAAKVAALQQAVSPRLLDHLMNEKLPSDVNTFAQKLNTIDENLRYRQRRPDENWTTVTQKKSSTYNSRHDSRPTKAQDPEPMDIDESRGRYAPMGSKEREKRTKEGRCFGCGSSKHLHRECPTMPYSRVQEERNLRSSSRGRRSRTSSLSSTRSRSNHSSKHSSKEQSRN